MIIAKHSVNSVIDELMLHNICLCKAHRQNNIKFIICLFFDSIYRARFPHAEELSPATAGNPTAAAMRRLVLGSCLLAGAARGSQTEDLSFASAGMTLRGTLTWPDPPTAAGARGAELLKAAAAEEKRVFGDKGFGSVPKVIVDGKAVCPFRDPAGQYTPCDYDIVAKAISGWP